MKEITEQTKCKIFALYYGQIVANHKETKGPLFDVASIFNLNCTKYINEYYELHLKPLSSISDEDAKEVAKIHYHYDELKIQMAPDRHIRDVKKYVTNEIEFASLHVVDFLRSKSYALPAFGYTTPELVTAGVFKLV